MRGASTQGAAAADHDEAAIATLWLEALRMQPQAAFLARKEVREA